MKKIIMTMIVCLYTSVVFAGGPTLGEFLGQELDALTSTESLLEKSEMEKETNWILTRIRTRIRPKIGLSIPFLAKLEIKPFVELYFDRAK